MTNTTKTASRVPRTTTPTFMFNCMDGPKTAPLRKEHLFGHLDHIEANNDKYRIAGPIRNKPDGDIIGSFFLVKAEDEAQAWEIMLGDPYIASNMYETITVTHFAPACGEWMGGVIWDQDEIRANLKKYV